MRGRALTRSAIGAFGKSVLIGGLVGAAPFLLFTLSLAAFSLPGGVDGTGSLLRTAWFAILPLVVSLALVVGTSLLVGVPATFLLRNSGRESVGAYMAVGCAAGMAVSGSLSLTTGVPAWLVVLGGCSGAATARYWGAATCAGRRSPVAPVPGQAASRMPSSPGT